eukprot:TRINITY_DN7305_c0_g2_i1.p1 TRINITY_DN7305_c0_g2~~TRINITY_DN7305_c0_g2_i1.p1  ORF type:complete len:673 (-),score=175.48 TRINITY_DN7305_c0_g2_i1:307-2325(-)
MSLQNQSNFDSISNSCELNKHSLGEEVNEFAEAITCLQANSSYNTSTANYLTVPKENSVYCCEGICLKQQVLQETSNDELIPHLPLDHICSLSFKQPLSAQVDSDLMPSTLPPKAQSPPVLKEYKTNERPNIGKECASKGARVERTAGVHATSRKTGVVKNLIEEFDAKKGKSSKLTQQAVIQSSYTSKIANEESLVTERERETVVKALKYHTETNVKTKEGLNEAFSINMQNTEKALIDSEVTFKQAKENLNNYQSLDYQESIQNSNMKQSISEFQCKEEPLSDSKVKDENDSEEIREKLKELDAEIEILRQEQEEVRKQKEHYDILFNFLQEETEKLAAQKEREALELEREKMEYAKKFIQERDDIQRHYEASSKKDREEILNLRRENTKLKEEMRIKEQSHKNALGKVRKEMEELSKQNTELQRRIKQLLTQSKGQHSPYKGKIQARMKTPNQKTGVKAEDCGAKTDRIKQQVTPIRCEGLRATSRGKSARETQPHKSAAHDRSLSKNFPSLINTSREEPKRNARGRNSDIGAMASIKKSNDSSDKNASRTFSSQSTAYDMIFLDKYHKDGGKLVSTTTQDGKVTRVFSNGKTEICFPNGVKRESFTDGYTIIYFNNKDVKQTYADGKVVYYFAEAGITQTTFPEGLQVFKFSNNQLEKHYSDGRKEIT